MLPEFDANDKRLRPEYDINYKQQIGTNDVYFGSADMDPTALPYSHMVVKVGVAAAAAAAPLATPPALTNLCAFVR